MTVHEADGSLSADVYWYNNWPVEERNLRSRTVENITRAQTRVEVLRKKVRKLPWRGEAESALAVYDVAFSNTNQENVFLGGWRLLEAIAGHPHENSKKLIERAAWFYAERDKVQQVGYHLLERRNLISDGRTIQANDNESLAFQMKQFLSPMLMSYLSNTLGFTSWIEFWNFCDLPVDPNERKQRALLLEKGAAFRREA